MITDPIIPEPFRFNPMKHHLPFILSFMSVKLKEENKIDVGKMVKEVRHIGTSVMDLYTGTLAIEEICNEIHKFLVSHNVDKIKEFSAWAGIRYSDYKTITISDSSQWMLKFHNDNRRFVHIFPARMSPYSKRIKANTLKTALLYHILIGKDFIVHDDLNKARRYLGLSPVKTASDAEAITTMIDILRRD
jgi:hypothetical protein